MEKSAVRYRIVVLTLSFALLLQMLAVVVRPVAAADSVLAEVPAAGAFERTWARTDKPVRDNGVQRTWMWGPEANTGTLTEPYADAPGGQRTVQYYDKSRMEDNAYRGANPWDVTNGLLVVELITGQRQVGDSQFEPGSPAQVPVAGDGDDPTGPTYATFTNLRNAAPLAGGSTITQRVSRDGSVSNDGALAGYGVTAAHYTAETNHQVASPFWTFMTSTGMVYENGNYTTGQLFQDPYYATGFPITEAYWAEVKVGGAYRDVLMQCFERRCLTYTPGNDPAWQVEAGNVGLHYYSWRSEDTANAYWDGTTDCFKLVGADGADIAYLDGTFPSGAQEVYFAAVGNGEDFGLGTARTSVTIQNLDVVSANVFFLVGRDSGWDFATSSPVAARGTTTLSASDLGIPSGQSRPVVAIGYNKLFVDDGCQYEPVFIGGVAKQAVAGMALPMTSSADTSVSGYNGVSGREAGYADEQYVPIVQTNCGPDGCWDTLIRIANVGWDEEADVNVRFYPADEGSVAGFQLDAQIGAGQSWTIKLSEHVDAGWVGSVHVTTDGAVVATADRFKADANMWMTNNAAFAPEASTWQPPSGLASKPYVLFVPDYWSDDSGRSTGITVANTVDTDNTVIVQYVAQSGPVEETVTHVLAGHGMEIFYDPSFVGGAVILSDFPVVAAVDGTVDAGGTLAAASYTPTAHAFIVQSGPLAYKSNPATGIDSTSEVNILNPNPEAASVTITFVDPSGDGSTSDDSTTISVPAYSTAVVYSLEQGSVPAGFFGSVSVVSDRPVVATTLNIDAEVSGDGATIWNLQNPCGMYRPAGGCSWENGQ